MLPLVFAVQELQDLRRKSKQTSEDRAENATANDV